MGGKGSQKDLNVMRKYRKSLFHLTMLTSIVAAATTLHTTNATETQAPLIINHKRPGIPFCQDQNERTIGRRLLYVTTLDGRLSALDITKGGKLRWSIPTGPGPLISSSIHRLELTSNGRFVRMIPSLSGGIYKFDGDYIDPIPITTEDLLSASAKFSEDLVISGGKETRTYGVSARTGQLLYECSMNGCVNATDASAATSPATQDDKAGDNVEYLQPHDSLVDDVVIVRRQTQTVRAVESRTGIERWNFSVGQHELDIIKAAECHDREFSEMDMAILDLDIKVIVPEGVICAFSKSDPSTMLWRYQFDHPIVSSWKMGSNDELQAIDMFGSAQWLWDQNENIFEHPYPTIGPSIYLGMYDKQLYIQESVTLRKEIADQSNLHTHLTTANEPVMPKIPWRPIPASSHQLMTMNHGHGNGNAIEGGAGNVLAPLPEEVHGNELVPYDEDNFAVSAQSVLNASEYVNGNGFYLYTKEDLNKTDGALCDSEEQMVEPQENHQNTNNGAVTNNTHGISDDFHIRLDDMDEPMKMAILYLWFWWKEIVVTFATTMMVIFLLKQRNTVEHRTVVIERHIPVPTAFEATESSTLALLGPVTDPANGGNSKSMSNGRLSNGGQRSLSESTNNSFENYSSRFQNDFELMRCLGRGGFGVVFEVKNKLDDCKYALKRITLPNKKESRERVMREVKTLANCEHQNIVRYFQAWVETPPPGWQEDEDRKWLAQETSTSIQIETPDGTTLPSFAGSGNHQQQKSWVLKSWMSNMASTACSSDHNDSGLNGIDCLDFHNGDNANGGDDDDDDSCIVFRSESQSMALREECEEISGVEESRNDTRNYHSEGNNNNNNNTPDVISIDIHSNSFDLGFKRGGRDNLDYSQLSDSFQIEFVRPTSENDADDLDGDGDGVGDGDKEDSLSKLNKSSDKSLSRRKRHLSLELSSLESNNNNSILPNVSAGAAAMVQQTAAQASPRPQQGKVYLYIQMQLCRKESLRDWLRENRVESREKHIHNIFRQIVDAVDYVHLKGLIHRDLKPSNIFFAQDGKIKIGDFGLVTDMSDIGNMVTECGDQTGLPSCARHTQQVGTHLYMSPEQLRGKHYDFKVDIYSLGLILFELLRFFGTEMERIMTLRDLRNGRYPNDFPDNHPDEYELLKLMLSQQPEERPATPQLKQKLESIFL